MQVPKRLMKDNGYPEPPRSACTFVPITTIQSGTKANKEEWEKVLQLDEELRVLDYMGQSVKKLSIFCIDRLYL